LKSVFLPSVTNDAERGIIRTMISKKFLTVAAVCMFAMLLLTGVLAASLVDTVLDREGYHPLTYVNPRDVVSEMQVEEGGVIEIKALRCNEQDNLFVTETSTFVNSEAGVTVPRPPYIYYLPAGCSEEVVRYTLPEGVTPGRWILGGRDLAVGPTGDTQTITWFTEEFEVVDNGE
jgi:hypothetical protein